MYRVICHNKDYKRYAAWVAGLFILVSCAQPSTKPSTGVESQDQNLVESNASPAELSTEVSSQDQNLVESNASPTYRDDESVTGVQPATGVVGDTAVSGDGADAGRIIASEVVDSRSLAGDIQPSEAEAAGSSLDQRPSPLKKENRRRKKRPKVSVGDLSAGALELNVPTPNDAAEASREVAGVTTAEGAKPSGVDSNTVDSNTIETAKKIAPKLDLSYVTIEKLRPVESFVVMVSPKRDVASEPASEHKIEVWLDEGLAASPNKILRQADISEVPPRAFRRKGAVLNRYYFVRAHDTVNSLAMLLYNDPNREKDLTRWNRGVWDPGRALFYSSPINPEDRKMVSFYEERGLAAEMVTMVPGECLRPLAARLYDSQVSWREIVAVNGLDDRDFCTPGAKLKVYPRDLLGAVSKLHPLPVPTVAQGITQSAEPHVGEGDTLADAPRVSDGHSNEKLPESGAVEPGVAQQGAPPVAEAVVSQSAPVEGDSAAVSSEKRPESGAVERGVASQSAPPAVEPLAESSQVIVPEAADEKLSLPNEPTQLPAFQPDSRVMKRAPSTEPNRPASAATPEP